MGRIQSETPASKSACVRPDRQDTQRNLHTGPGVRRRSKFCRQLPLSRPTSTSPSQNWGLPKQTMKNAIWIGSRPPLKCAMFKKDMLLQPWQSAIRIQFNFERVYCIQEGHNLLLNDGNLLPVTTVYTGGKALIGRNDQYQTGLDYNDDARAFRAALDQRAIEAAGVYNS